MICSKCGQELKDGVKFCTKCGAKFGTDLTSENKIFTYLSLILSVIGIIGLNVVLQINLKQTAYNPKINTFFWLFRLSMFAGTILAVIALYKQKCKLAFIAGLIPCAYYILSTLPNFLQFLQFLNRIFVF